MAADTTARPPPSTTTPAPTPTARAAGIGNPVLGMLLFITSEMMFFAGLFAAYFSIRAASSTRTASTLAAEQSRTSSARSTSSERVLTFIAGDDHPRSSRSFTCQFAVWAIRQDDRTTFLRNMAVTVVLGITFLRSRSTTTASSSTRG